ncbi:EamA family transporter [Micromonospora arborensis]|uniref:EamA family transporter n=1 Tax=Micromonospora arborensis TaxID=2116518 RepID=A0A318NE93_9ACTN|nr:EamA family transporter [Micromonospora arborensis]PYC66902.1 EamA family transporter [Micromonospora arborensis]
MLETHPRREVVVPSGRVTTSDWAITGLASLAPVTWGTTYLVTTQWLPPDRPLLSGVLRALPAGLIALLLARRLPDGVWWWRAAALGALNIGAFFVLLFVAAYRLPGGVAATLSAAQPLIVAGLAVALLAERPSRWRLGWGLVGVVGIAVMVLRGRLGFDPIGLAAGFAGTAVMAAGTVLTKRWGRPPGVGVLAFTGWQLTAGGLLIAPLALAVEGLPPRLDAPALGGYAWLSLVGTGLAYTLWFTGLAHLPVTAMSFLPLLSPIVAAVLGWLVLGQSLTATQLLGFGLALVSISAAQLDPTKQPLARLAEKS